MSRARELGRQGDCGIAGREWENRLETEFVLGYAEM